MSNEQPVSNTQPGGDAGEITDLWFAVHALSDAVRAIAAAMPVADSDPLGRALADLERALQGRELPG